MSKTNQVNSISLGLARCKNCEIKLHRIDDPQKGFCSDRCKKIFEGINSISRRNLTHIVFWYYIQRGAEMQQSKNKRAHISTRKLLEEIREIFE